MNVNRKLSLKAAIVLGLGGLINSAPTTAAAAARGECAEPRCVSSWECPVGNFCRDCPDRQALECVNSASCAPGEVLTGCAYEI